MLETTLPEFQVVVTGLSTVSTALCIQGEAEMPGEALSTAQPGLARSPTAMGCALTLILPLQGRPWGVSQTGLLGSFSGPSTVCLPF